MVKKIGGGHGILNSNINPKKAYVPETLAGRPFFDTSSNTFMGPMSEGEYIGKTIGPALKGLGGGVVAALGSIGEGLSIPYASKLTGIGTDIMRDVG